MTDDKVLHPSGATSSRLDERYDLIPYSTLQAMARRFAMGAAKHGENNWKKGDAAYARERLNHLWQHLAAFTEKGKQEDLDAILCNAAMLAEMKSRGLMPEAADFGVVEGEFGAPQAISYKLISLPANEFDGSGTRPCKSCGCNSSEDSTHCWKCSKRL